MSSEPIADQTAPLPRPASIVAIAGLLALEAVGVLAAAGWYLSSLGAPGPVPLGGRIFMLALLVGAAVWQAAVALNVFRGRPWTRAAALVWQVFQVIFAVPLIGGATTPVGVGLLVPAGAIIVLLFDPRVTAYFGDRAERS